jgi:hypothetical protein
MERNRIKIGWTTALIAVGWVLMFMPSAEDLPDAEPASRADWIVWMGINVDALGAVHYWISQPSRESKREARAVKSSRLVAARRARINARHSHPTAR